MSKRILNIVRIAALAGLALAQPALAADGKVFSGAACQKVLGSGTYGGGTVRNNSAAGSLTVNCPAVRDLIAGDIQDGQVRVYQAGGTTWCTLHVKSYVGASGVQQFVSSANGQGYRTLNFAGMNAPSNRPYYYWCALPPSDAGATKRSRVIGYRVDEQ